MKNITNFITSDNNIMVVVAICFIILMAIKIIKKVAAIGVFIIAIVVVASVFLGFNMKNPLKSFAINNPGTNLESIVENLKNVKINSIETISDNADGQKYLEISYTTKAGVTLKLDVPKASIVFDKETDEVTYDKEKNQIRIPFDLSAFYKPGGK